MASRPAQYEALTYLAEGPVATVSLNRPERLNALNERMVRELGDVVDHLSASGAVRVAIFTGTGRAFCAGADIRERVEQMGNPDEVNTTPLISALFRRMERLDQILIAAVDGTAAGGGCELAMACDLRIAAVEATFALPEVRLGILPGAGGTQRLPRLVGLTRAKEMMLLARFISAAEAESWGLVNQVVPGAELMQKVKEVAQKLLEMPPLALVQIKHAANLSLETDIDSGLRFEQQSSLLLRRSADRVEGHRAFLEKRKPDFQGR